MTDRRLATKAGTDLYHAVVGMTGARDGSAWFEQVAAIEAEARASLDVDVLARALPAVSHVLWSRSMAGDHIQVWFDEDVLRHFNEWAEDTADAIAREYRAILAEPQP